MSKIATPEIIEFILKEGNNSTSFLTLYSGFNYFRKEINGHHGLIAYMESTSAWIGASDPVCSDFSIAEELILEFFEEAKKNNKDALMLPVSKPIAHLIKKNNLFSIQIGSEPWFKLDEIPAKLPTAKQLLSKGAVVECFDPEQINSREYVEVEEVTRHWLKSRKMLPLGFLNRLEPWTHLKHKKYFRVIFNGHQVSYLAAVPTRNNKAWYLVDLIRLPNAPLGTTELLISEAMKQLRQNGAQEVTLGMSPLVCFDEEEKRNHPRAYQLMDFAFNKLGAFYNFKSLYQYKDKFHPDLWEPTYLVASTKSINLMSYYSLFKVLLPHGFFSILYSSVSGLFKNINFRKAHDRIFSDQIALRGIPHSIFEFLFRIKTTLIFASINILFFSVANESSGSLRSRFIDDFAYQWNRLVESGFSYQSFQMLIIPSLLHWNFTHLFTNLVFLIVFVGLLELLAGSVLVSIAYFFGILFSNLITSLVLMLFLYPFSQTLASNFAQSLDVGSSLGIFSCIGTLTYLLKYSKTFLTVATIGICVVAYYQQDLLSFNHLTAIAIGLVIARFFIPKELS